MTTTTALRSIAATSTTKPAERKRSPWARRSMAFLFAAVSVGSTIALAPASSAAPAAAADTKIEIIDAVSRTAATGGTVYKSADFNSMPLGAVQPTDFNNALGATNKNAAAYDDMTVVADAKGGKAIRTVLKAGTIHSIPSGDNGDNLFVSLPASYDSACIQYDIKFDANFDWSLGGKLPGLLGVTPGTAPSKPTGGNATELGWSGRMMWLGPKAYKWAGPTNMAVSYMYHPGQAGTYGDNVRWNKPFLAGTWHTVKQCYTMNTVGKADGVLTAWIDGQQVVNSTDYVYRTRADLHINYISYTIFRGGNTIDWAGSRDNYIDIDNMSVTAS